MPSSRPLHRQLDEAVAGCYGWPKKVAQDGNEIVRRLLTLNREIASGARPYDPFRTGSAAIETQPPLALD